MNKVRQTKKEYLIEKYIKMIVENIVGIYRYGVYHHYTPKKELYVELDFWFEQHNFFRWLKLEKALEIFAKIFLEIPFSVDIYSTTLNDIKSCKYFELNGE